MKLKNILGFGVAAYFTYKGISKLMQYDRDKSPFDDTISEIGKDAIDGINHIVTIFSDDENEKRLCDSVSQLTKTGIDVVTNRKMDF